jgi:hypothetical protein
MDPAPVGASVGIPPIGAERRAALPVPWVLALYPDLPLPPILGKGRQLAQTSLDLLSSLDASSPWSFGQVSDDNANAKLSKLSAHIAASAAIIFTEWARY